MVELWLKLITEVAVDWILPMMVVLGSIVAFLVVGSYWSRQGEERLLVQCALAAVALHFLLFVTAYQLPRAIPTPFPSREVRVAVELKGMEEEKPIETLSEHRAPIGETPKVETIEAAPAELAIEPTRPDVAAETAELPELIQQPQDAIPPIENDPLLPDASPITVPENSASIAETAPIRPSEEISRTPAEESVTRVETNGETSAVLPPIDPSRPAPAPIYALNELVTPSISSTEAPDETRNREDQTPIRPSEEMARQSDEQNPSRESTLPEIAEAPDLPMTPAPIPPEIEIPPAEPSTAPIDSVQAPTVRPPTAESKPVIPSESISRERHAEVAVRNEPQPTEAIPVTPEISAASPPFPELPMNEEAMVLAPPLPLEGVKVDAPDVKPLPSSSEQRIPTEAMKKENLSAATPSRSQIATDSAAPPIPGDLPSPPSRGADIEAPSASVERGSLPNVTGSIEPPATERKREPAKQTLVPTSDALKVDRTAESPVRRPSNTSNTMPDSPSLPRSLSMTELPARTGIDTPLEIPTPLPGTNTSATPTPSSTPTIVPKRFNLDVAMAKPESRVERRSPVPSDDTSKLNLKELVPDSTSPPYPVEASINFWDNRLAPNRLAIVYRHGGSDETERAVNSALDWLAAHQSPDGRWDSDGFDAACPRGDKCDGHAIERESDTGLTGLALLAFLGAGHTHLETTKHRETVRRGLSWLIRMQRPDGDLQNGGRIYCHSMATLALTEAYAMTNDQRLRAPAQRAILWLAAAQHPETGGWRYAPRETGDTSVYGWAVLSLRSARQAKLDVPEQTWLLAKRWIPSISTGAHGGLACYRPGYPPSHAMTAEALFCRQVLGDKIENELINEAADYLAARLPDAGDYHIYYWYYGTLSLFQTGGSRWDRWNQRLTATLLETQRKTGHAKGSWEPRTPFGIDGGRIFSTAVSAMCLEVYYRYLPLYEQAKRDKE